MEVCNAAVVCGNTPVGEGRSRMAPEELATVTRSVERAVAMCYKTIVVAIVVEITVVKVAMVMVKDDE